MQTKFSKFYRFLLLIICFLFYVACSESGKVSPKAVSGVLDLREWNFETDGNINLDGEWEFYWDEVLDLNQITERKACFESNDKVCRDNFLTDEIAYREPLIKYISKNKIKMFYANANPEFSMIAIFLLLFQRGYLLNVSYLGSMIRF